MSGGSMDYIFFKVEEVAYQEQDAEIADMLKDLAGYLHDEEWWLSCDYSKDDWAKARDKFKAKWFGTDRTERLRGYVDEGIERLRGELYELLGVGRREGERDGDVADV